MKIVIIAAVSKNNIIGKEGKIPWHFPEELKHFKETTTRFPVIMGRKTFESIGKPLINRMNIIITSHPELFIKFEEVKCFPNLKEALLYCEKNNHEKVFVAGGGAVYTEALCFADEMIISRMNIETDGDTFFPPIEADAWNEKNRIVKNNFEIVTYSKKENDRN